MDKDGFKSYSRTFKVVESDEEVALIWSDTEDALFDPGVAVQLAYALIRAANKATTGRLKDA